VSVTLRAASIGEAAFLFPSAPAPRGEQAKAADSLPKSNGAALHVFCVVSHVTNTAATRPAAYLPAGRHFFKESTMSERVLRVQAYTFACLAAISAIAGAATSFGYLEMKEAYRAEQARSSALAARLQEAMAARDEEQDEDQATDSGGETAVAAVQTLAIRNNNPLNVKTVKGRPWFGQIAVDKHGHAVFDTPEHGIRAGANVLLNYYAVHGLDTLEGILSRFCTGNRAEYATFLSRRLGIPSDVKFDVLARLPELLHAMARFESGQEWPRELFTGYSLVATAYRKGQR
jgi:hypothetical protein